MVLSLIGRQWVIDFRTATARVRSLTSIPRLVRCSTCCSGDSQGFVDLTVRPRDRKSARALRQRADHDGANLARRVDSAYETRPCTWPTRSAAPRAMTARQRGRAAGGTAQGSRKSRIQVWISARHEGEVAPSLWSSRSRLIVRTCSDIAYPVKPVAPSSGM